MENPIRLILSLLLFLISAAFTYPACAQTVSIPDPALNAAVRAALQKPTGPLTQQDLLLLTNLSANGLGIQNVAGLEAARNLTSLNLDDNQIASFNSLSNLSKLTSLVLSFNAFTAFSLPAELTNLGTLNLRGNQLTTFSMPGGLSNLRNLDLSENLLAGFVLPGASSHLTQLNLAFNQLGALYLPTDMSDLLDLNLGFNRLTSLTLPSNLAHLTGLHLNSNQLSSFNLHAGLTNLTRLDLAANHLGHVSLPADLAHLSTLRISGNHELQNLTLPVGLTSLTSVFLRDNALATLTLPPGLTHLVSIDAIGNRLTSLILPAGLTSLENLFLGGNQITTLTLPADITKLTSLLLGLPNNPLESLVLSELLADGNLSDEVLLLRSQGVTVSTFPLALRLVSFHETAEGAFAFDLIGPPGTYTLFTSPDLFAWTEVGTLSNSSGTAPFTDAAAFLSSRKFYRASLKGTPQNMVLIAPNTSEPGSQRTNRTGTPMKARSLRSLGRRSLPATIE